MIEAFWFLFEETGSITAYLAYKSGLQYQEEKDEKVHENDRKKVQKWR